jgi:hypothetical protein
MEMARQMQMPLVCILCLQRIHERGEHHDGFVEDLAKRPEKWVDPGNLHLKE